MTKIKIQIHDGFRKFKKEYELLTCPFCDSEASIKKKYSKGSYSFMFPGCSEGVPMYVLIWIGCFNSKCGVKPAIYSNDNEAILDEAIKRWNIRKSKLN